MLGWGGFFEYFSNRIKYDTFHTKPIGVGVYEFAVHVYKLAVIFNQHYGKDKNDRKI